jgi:hypothetical protein
MKLGIGKAIITPPLGTPLCGFVREQGAQGVLDDLEVRVFWLQDGDSAADAVCIVSADLIGFCGDTADILRAAIAETCGVLPDRILLAASHTHSGPQVGTSLITVGDSVPEVADEILRLILEAAKQAQSELHPVTLHGGKGFLKGYAINRRGIENGESDLKPNPEGPRDDEVTVLSFRDKSSGNLRAILFHFTCHACVLNGLNVSADYPGATRRFIENESGERIVAGFLPGCCGNIDPFCTYIGGEYSRAGLPRDVELFGAALGREVMRVARESSRELTPCLAGRMVTLDLPFQRFPSREELEHTRDRQDEEFVSQWNAEYQRTWAVHMLAMPEFHSKPLMLQRIDLARDATLVAMSGEVCVEYGLYIKSLHPDSFMIPMGYSNGLIGYIPTAAMLDEGGYEPVRSGMYYGFPSPLKPEVEEIVREGIRSILE